MSTAIATRPDDPAAPDRTPPPRPAEGVPPAASASPGPAEPIAELDRVGRRFGDVVALDDLTLKVRPGSLVGVIGPSGAGKTTAIRVLTGGLRPTSGTARVLGQDPTHLRISSRERIGFMPQGVSLYDDLTVVENLDFVASLFGLLLPRRRRRIKEILAWLDLADARGRRAVDLSGGMRRRLQLGCALVHDPALAFLDEPTGGIDPIVRRAIWSELRRLRDVGRTFVVTTQLVPEAEECDEVALVVGGRLIAFAAPEELRRQAYGGQVLEVETSAMIAGEQIAGLPLVDEVRQLGPRRLAVVTPDAASATPTIVSSVEDQGGAVDSIQESRPSFDDVFARLVERATGAAPGDPAADAAARGQEPDAESRDWGRADGGRADGEATR